jgi:hypothetical protein
VSKPILFLLDRAPRHYGDVRTLIEQTDRLELVYSRFGTRFYRLKTDPQQVQMVLWFMGERFLTGCQAD